MSDSNVTFESKGRKLAGTVRVPDGVGPGEHAAARTQNASVTTAPNPLRMVRLLPVSGPA